ncbi:peroxiredoxin family protein [Streptosporangium canum]|uniref:peroxiredoxin family protein n=1 Tax=Streptosporangium canum TaxID=324952 RepID=UPI00369FBB18
MMIVYALCSVLAAGLIVNLVMTVRLSSAVSMLRHESGFESRDHPLSAPHLHGSTVPHFEARSTKGALIGSATLGEEIVTGFFMVGCPPCKTALPFFIDTAKRVSADDIPVIAVIRYESSEVADKLAHAEELRTLIGQLEEYSHVITEDGDQEVISTFGQTFFPAFYRLHVRPDGLYVAKEAPTPLHMSELEHPQSS